MAINRTMWRQGTGLIRNNRIEESEAVDQVSITYYVEFGRLWYEEFVLNQCEKGDNISDGSEFDQAEKPFTWISNRMTKMKLQGTTMKKLQVWIYI